MLLASTALGFAIVYIQDQEYLIRKDAPPTDAVPPPRWIELGVDYNRLCNATDVLNTVVDLVATVIITSRIWYMARQLENALGQGAGVRYRAAVSMFVESGVLILISEVLTTALGYAAHTVIAVDVLGLASNITLMLVVITPTLIIVRVGMHKGFDSVVETMHELYAPRDAQVRSIKFAQRRTTDTATNITNFAHPGAVIQDSSPESDSESVSVDSRGGLSVASGQREGVKEKKVDMTEVHLDIV
ncbi:hypothetical protein EVG20_g1777 [Dentipellis fragilis]|uniref:Uncharacterized protein n=1 Tax=Dentipellis fragilis TaxID=205917 RepID=A0A4Y9ZCS6_9AGAM|nr:hypothetical protein EVG20_g1777 [Dentipellis fragilis]